MRIVILGVGNILLTDEGVGVRVVEALGERYRLPPEVELIDGGTCGMEFLEQLENLDALIVVAATPCSPRSDSARASAPSTSPIAARVGTVKRVVGAAHAGWRGTVGGVAASAGRDAGARGDPARGLGGPQLRDGGARDHQGRPPNRLTS